MQLRSDDIGTIGLYHTRERRRLDTVREDSVLQTSTAVFAQNETAWTPWLRTLAGVRADGYRFAVDAGVAANGGTEYAGLVSPKGGVILGPCAKTEVYVNAGYGFHSNDARGATITVDPVDRLSDRSRDAARAGGRRRDRRAHDADPADADDADGVDAGARLGAGLRRRRGHDEASRPSRRDGIEWSTFYSPRPWLTFDADVALSRARFTDDDPAGARIPGAVATVVTGGATVDSLHNVFATVRWRYFGPRPLVEDDSRRSKATSLASLSAGYKFTSSLRLSLDVFNLFNARHSDIDYFYTSRLPGEPLGGVDDIHLHPATPRTARLNLIVGF